MSAPEQSTATPQTVSPATSSASAALNDLRGMVCGLGLGMVVLSVAFGAFVIRQNILVSNAVKLRKQQTEQMKGALQKQETLKQWEQTLNELAQYSKGNPELTAIFTKYRVDISGAGATPPPAPPAPQKSP